MSKMNGFKVTLSLARVFNDHRRICRAYVNLNRMQTIDDLHEHIRKMFNLNNFYLMVENQFLPDTENIRILNVNDCISVIPLQPNLLDENNINSSTPHELNETNNSLSEKLIENTNQKRKKNNKETLFPNKKLKDSFTPSNECLQGSTPVDINEKTCRQDKTLKRTNLIARIDDDHGLEVSKFSSVEENVNDTSSCNFVKDKVEYFEKHIDLSNPKQQSSESPNNSSLEITNITDVMKKHKLFIKPNDSLKIMSTKLPHQQNIIKNIVVSTSQESRSSSGFNSVEVSSSQVITLNGENDTNSLNNSNCIDMKQNQVQLSDKINILQDIIIPNNLIEISNDSVSVEIMETEEMRSEISQVTSEPVLNDIQTNVTKRKRVRTRKRKLKNIQPEKNININKTIDFKMNVPKVAPIMHIKFDEDGNAEHLTNGDGQQENYEETQQEPHEESDQVIIVNVDSNCDEILKKDSVEYVPNRNEMEEMEEGEKIQNANICNQSIKKTENENFFKHLPEKIESYPLLENKSLQPGNVIAFKLLKLGNLLIPEMTNYIVGGVMEINNDGKDVVINVLDGLEEAKSAADSLFEGDELIDIAAETIRRYEIRHLLAARLISKENIV